MSAAFAIYPSLRGVSVVVTGGASGIGAEIVRAFAGQGARIGFVDFDVERGTALASELGEGGAQVRFERCDLRDIDDLRRAFTALAAAQGPPRVLVNNAARDDRHLWQDVTPEFYDERIATKDILLASQPTLAALRDAEAEWMVLSKALDVFRNQLAEQVLQLEGNLARIDALDGRWKETLKALTAPDADETPPEVLARVRVSLFEPRGDFQLLCEHLEPAGEGALRLELERLKRRLAAEGLFDPARKRPLPPFPRQVGVITSPIGAASGRASGSGMRGSPRSPSA